MAGCLSAPDAYEYGMLLIEEKGETERGKCYLEKAASIMSTVRPPV